MNQSYSKLFEPTNIGTVKLKNRISMAPMGLVGFSDYMGGFTENAQNYYIERAKGGVGLIITGICCVDYNEIVDFGLPCPGYNPIAFAMTTTPMIEKIHAYDAKIFIQLTGGLGRSAVPGLVKQFIAPSENENRFDPDVGHRALEKAEIEALIQSFVKSAAAAKRAGFDGVEIHAVHEGYLLDQFAIPLFNRRTDEYGGDLKGRLKIATDIVKGIKNVCGNDFPVSMRYSVKSFMKGLRQGILPGETATEVGKDYDEGIKVAKLLVQAGYDSLNVDVGTYDSWYWNHPPMYFEDGMYREFGRMVKQAVDVPVILAGRLDDPDVAIDALNGCCDIVSYGRPLLADPYLLEKILTDQLEDIRPCLSCHDGCMGRIASGLALSCAVNPACGRELVYGVQTAEHKETILIIGGGPAGMEAARVSALRGHKVMLVEKDAALGGNLKVGSVPDFKKNDARLVKWYVRQLEKLGVDVRTGQTADKDFLHDQEADRILIATGATPVMLSLGSENKICAAEDILSGKVAAGQNIVVIGGGLVGCETALWLAKQGLKVTVVEIQEDILGGTHGMPLMNSSMLRELLIFNNVDIYTGVNVDKITKDTVEMTTAGKKLSVRADTVVVSVGYQTNATLYKEISQLGIPVYNIGDSREVKNVMHAIWNAYEVARSI